MRKFLLPSALALAYGFRYYKSSLNSKIVGCDEGEPQRAAICILNPHGDNSNCKGLVYFSQDSMQLETLIKAKVTGLKKNKKHGIHVHNFGDLTDGCNTAGPHFNPTDRPHGGPDDEIRHFGDLGNLQADDNGVAVYERKDKFISLIGKYSVVGRSVVVHEDEDDLGRGNFPDSKTTGHSGCRIACGIIALGDPAKTYL